MANFFQDNDDLRYQFSQVDWAALIPHVEFGEPKAEKYTDIEEAQDFYSQMLDALGQYVADEIAPHWEEFDTQHPELKDGEGFDGPRMAKTMAGLAEMGALGLGLPRRYGGMNAPLVVSALFMEMLARAEVSAMSHLGFHSGVAQILMLYAMDEGSVEIEDGEIKSTRFDDQINKVVSESEWGAMVLTEPGAGSDLAKIRATAVEKEDGWQITGQKIFITSGHGEHHIVLARSEPEKTHPGLKGLSLFYCPAHIEKDGGRIRNFEIGGFESKMGQHSAVAATLNYDQSEAELIGKRGHGFRLMLMLMNNARIAVGFEALGICERAYRIAAEYAEERESMGKKIAEHEMIADYLDEMDCTIRGLRAITVQAAFEEEMVHRLRSELRAAPPDSDEDKRAQQKQINRHKRRARHLTPLIKYVAGEESVRISRMAMQILGGIGYITEYPAEKLLRDALVLPVYEGTSQIQALMALKDNLQSFFRNPTRFFSESAATKLDARRAKNPLVRGHAKIKDSAQSAMLTIVTRIATDKLPELSGVSFLEWKKHFTGGWDPKKDFSFGLLHAERLTRILAAEAIAARLVEQAQKAVGTEHEEDRKLLARHYIERMEPRCRGILEEIEATSGSLLRRLFSRKKPDSPDEPKSKKSAA